MAAVMVAATPRSGVGAGRVGWHQRCAYRWETAYVIALKPLAKATAKAGVMPPTAPRRAPTLPPPRVPPTLRRQAVLGSHPDGGGGARTNESSVWSSGGDGGDHREK